MCCISGSAISESENYVISRRGVDLRYFQPYYVRSRHGKDYKSRIYKVRLPTDTDITCLDPTKGPSDRSDILVPIPGSGFTRRGVVLEQRKAYLKEQTIIVLATKILKRFPYSAFTDIRFLSEYRNQRTSRFDESEIYRIIKDSDGQIRVLTGNLSSESEMKELGYSEIIISTCFGGKKFSKDKDIYDIISRKKGDWSLSEQVKGLY